MRRFIGVGIALVVGMLLIYGAADALAATNWRELEEQTRAREAAKEQGDTAHALKLWGIALVITLIWTAIEVVRRRK